MNTTNLVSWLPLDESTTLDLCGNTWTASGNPTIQGGALYLDGSSYLQLDGGLTFGGQDFTIRGKFNMKSATSSWGRLFEFNVAGGSSRFELVRYSSESTIRINGYGSWVSSKFETIISDSILNQDVDIEIDYVHDAGRLYVFFDGILKATIKVTFTRQQIQYVRLGAGRYESKRYFAGTIDEFQIYDGVALHTENFTPPTEDDYFADKLALIMPFTFDADAEVKINNASYVANFINRNGLVAWLPLHDSPVEDYCSNTWTAGADMYIKKLASNEADANHSDALWCPLLKTYKKL